MLTIEEIRKKLKDRNLREIARRLEISYNTIYGIATGKHQPYESVKILSDYLECDHQKKAEGE